MHSQLLQAQAILFDFENSLKEIENLHLSKGWKDDLTKRFLRSYLHGATEVSECNELEEWLYPELLLSKIAKQNALTHYHRWAEFIFNNGVYVDFSETDLVFSPRKEENLYHYTQRLSYHVQDHGWGSKKNKRALRSYLFYLRKTISKKEISFLEHIFPKNMDLRYGSLIRLVRSQSHSISEQNASEIIKALGKAVMVGRSNAMLKNAEALALCWICLTSSRLRLPTTLECLHATPLNAITIRDSHATIQIPTIFGPYSLKISQRVALYLQAIAKTPSAFPRNAIIQSTLHDLRRSLKSAIKKALIPEKCGNITFLTFMSPPHHAGKNIRPQN